jgi:predicted porin
MRKLLLASAALLGLAGPAFAAGLIEINPTTSPPSVGDATGVAIPPNKSAFVLSPPFIQPDPGKIIIRLDGLIAWDVGFASGGGNQAGNFVTGPGGRSVQTGTGKVEPFAMAGYTREYFGADGQLLNGVLYGAAIEFRSNFAGTTATGYSGTGAMANASANTQAYIPLIRRSWGYVGTPHYGFIRFGQGDGPLSLFTSPGITTGEAFSTGAWDGDVPDLMTGNEAGDSWPYYDTGNEYDSNKIVYLSPVFFGAQGAISFAPNSSNNQPNECSNNAGNCINQASSTLPSDYNGHARPRNIFEIAGRWTGNLGPVAVDSMLGWIHSAVVNNGNFGVLSGPRAKGVDVIDGGASLTFLGASIFGHFNGGTADGVATPSPIITVANGYAANRGTPKEWTWVAGGQYSIGPWTAGASYWYYQHPGTSTTAIGNDTMRGIAVGGDYSIAPGWDMFLEYLYGKRRQNGVNLVDNNGPSNLHNCLCNINGIAFTTSIRW